MWQRILNSPWLYFGGAALLLVFAVASQLEIRWPARPEAGVEEGLAGLDPDELNVVFILVDTLRADRLGSYGYERDTSPVLDQLAATGVRFDRVIAQSSWTKTSMASLWTATYPARNRITRWSDGLSDSTTLPAEVLKERGFVTGGIYRNNWVAPNFGFAQGFDRYFVPQPSREQQRIQKPNFMTGQLKGSDEDATEASKEFLRSYAGERFFLYIHYMDVHQYTYDAISARFGTSYSDIYDSAIHWTDRNIADVVSTLRDLELMDETIVVVASDHGEGFGEHGMEGHARTLYREVVHVPLVMILPFRLPEGLVVEQTVQNVDIVPTLYDLLGLEEALPAQVQGVSLVPAIRAAARGERVPELEERPAWGQLDRSWGRPKAPANPIVSITQGRYRLIRPLGSREEIERFDSEEVEGSEGDELAPLEGWWRSWGIQLYDHETDPWEQENLAEERPELARRLARRTLRHAESSAEAGEEPRHVELNQMELQQLRALGYMR